MNTPKPGVTRRVLGFFWDLITWTRIAVFNILFLFCLFVIFLAVIGSLSQDIQPIPEQTTLRVQLKGRLVDQLSVIDPLTQITLTGPTKVTDAVVRHVVTAIDAGAEDDRITKLLLDLNNFAGGGLSKLDEVGQALSRFKNSGKEIIAISDSYSQAQYFLASYADRIYLHPMGMVEITGFSAFGNYFKDALDKLEVNVHVFRVGDYKDAVEPYTRNEMSDASREHNAQWVNEMWEIYSSIIENQRQLPKGAIDNLINNYDEYLNEVGGDMAQLALDHQLVDYLSTRDELRNKLNQDIGQHPLTKQLQVVDYNNYFRHVQNKKADTADKIGLIVAAGNIYDGEQPPGSIGGDSLAKLIRQAREDDDVKAVVLRIDSGGGSAFASEIIREEVVATQAKGKPVVVSMGSVAASGGYWIAADADEIWATPTTITGSIGVFSIFPTIENTLNKIGVHSDGINTTELAGWSQIDRPLSPLAADMIQQNVEYIYRRFINLVAEGREMMPDLIHPIAQGRVWSATRAQEFGLVDQLGYLQDAIAAAAQRANLSQYNLELIEKPLSPWEQFLIQLSNASVGVFDSARDEGLASMAMKLQRWRNNNSLQTVLTLMQNSGDANPVLAHCLTCVDPLN